MSKGQENFPIFDGSLNKSTTITGSPMVKNMHQGCNVPPRLFQVLYRPSNPRTASSTLMIEHPSDSFFCQQTNCLVEVIPQLPGRHQRYVSRDSHPIPNVPQQGTHTHPEHLPCARRQTPTGHPSGAIPSYSNRSPASSRRVLFHTFWSSISH